MEKPEIERKFLLKNGFLKEELPKSLRYKVLIIIQDYLMSDGNGSRRLRRTRQERPSLQAVKYFLTKKRPTSSMMKKMEDEKELSSGKYFELLKELDLECDRIRKKRIVFFWKKQKFELDIFLEPKRLLGLVIMEIELEKENQKVRLPPFIPIAREVTYVPGWTNHDLAKRPK